MSSPAPQAAPGSTRLYLDDVPTPVVARVARRTPEALTLSQDLHFLRLHKGVRDAEGRHAELASVYLAVHGDTPRLMLELRYTEGPVAASESPTPASGLRRARSDAAEAYAPLGVSQRPPRRDATVPYVVGEEGAADPAPAQAVVDTVDDDVTQLFRVVDAERDTLPASSALVLAHRMPVGAWLQNAVRAAVAWLGRVLR